MIKNHFLFGNDGWRCYDYDADHRNERNHQIPLKWSHTGGADNSGYVWADDSFWTIDLPESPVSILAFMFYQEWVGRDDMDMRDAQVSVYLRGDGLDLKGGHCRFWCGKRGSRWHLSSNPLQIAEGTWADKPLKFTAKNDESVWHRSWSGMPWRPKSLDETLGECTSYGFSFIGFSEKVTGRFSMSRFEVRPQA